MIETLSGADPGFLEGGFVCIMVSMRGCRLAVFISFFLNIPKHCLAVKELKQTAALLAQYAKADLSQRQTVMNHMSVLHGSSLRG